MLREMLREMFREVFGLLMRSYTVFYVQIREMLECVSETS